MSITWTPSIPSAGGYWNCVTCSSDGTKLVAAGGLSFKKLCTSIDSGASWTLQANAYQLTYISLDCSSDGVYIYATGSGTIGTDTGWFVVSSQDSGVNWSIKYFNATYQILSIACSSDGSKVAFISNRASFDAYIFHSTDFGSNWVDITGVYYDFRTISMSSDGSTIAVGANGGQLKISHTSGSTWFEANSSIPVYCISMSNDGTIILVGGIDIQNPLRLTYDGGLNWVYPSLNFKTLGSLVSCVMAIDGSKMVTVRDANSSLETYYVSFNYGGTWYPQTGPINNSASAFHPTRLAGSDDLTFLIKAFGNGNVPVYLGRNEVSGTRIDIDSKWDNVTNVFTVMNGEWVPVNTLKLKVSGDWKDII
jgi:photosystem II stability/assembly factor-like uncharacterized protein